MSDQGLQRRMRWYQGTALFSVLFALMGFSYNVWRLEVTEHNNNVRSASFEMLLQLAELEQVVYAAHYDQDAVAGSPRLGWVKVGLVADLSIACGEQVRAEAETLRTTWGDSWAAVAESREATDTVVVAIDEVRAAVQAVLLTLE